MAATLAAAGCSQSNTVATIEQKSPAGAPVIAPDQPIKVGFIGIGGRGRALLSKFVKLKGHQIVAICDIDPTRRSQAAEIIEKAQGKAPAIYGEGGKDDFKKLLDRKDVDAIITATPCYEHARIGMATILAGKHLYGEKPLGITVKQCDDMVRLTEANPKLVVQVGFQWMATPHFTEPIKRIHNGEIGELIEGRFARHNGASPLRGWFSHRAESGDWMLEQACHEYNIMCWVAGGPPIQAYGMGREGLYTAGEPDRDVTDYYAAIIEFPNKFIVHYAHGWISPEGFTGMDQKVIGSKGAIDVGGDRISMRDKDAKVAPIKVEAGDDTEMSLQAFLDSIRQGKPPVAPVHNGRNASLTALLVRKAVYERRVVTWKEMLRTC